MILFPNAKINIGLNITSKRNDGYHEIESIMYPIGWHDILEIVPSKENKTTLTVSGRKVDCPIEKNLIIKAVNAISEHIEIPPVDIFLRKIIPDGAGLGGGSADAAFTLKGLNELFSLKLSEKTLCNIASNIGADCPFFIYNRPTFASGIGTTFSTINLDLTGYNILLIKPNVSVPTAKAYAGVTPCPPKYKLENISSLPIGHWQDSVINDFERSIFKSHPQISEIKDFIINMGAVYASMSGSGSAVYGLFKRDNLAETAHQQFPNYDIFECSL